MSDLSALISAGDLPCRLAAGCFLGELGDGHLRPHPDAHRARRRWLARFRGLRSLEAAAIVRELRTVDPETFAAVWAVLCTQVQLEGTFRVFRALQAVFADDGGHPPSSPHTGQTFAPLMKS